MSQSVTPSEELRTYLEYAVLVAREAGAIIKDVFYSKSTSLHIKDQNPTDLVTATDQLVEKLVFGKLKEKYPQHKFVGEETTASGEAWKLSEEPTWIVDPIDGTTNFVHGFPFVAVSIGLAINKEPVVGVVYNPILDELYTGAKGLGAHLNGAILPLTQPNIPPLPDLAHCLFVTEYGADRLPSVINPKVSSIHRMAAENTKDSPGGRVRGIRSTGSAALNLCMLARGGSDIYWEIGVHVWDIAAAMVVLQESGGLVVDGTGRWGVASSQWSQELRNKNVNILGRKVLGIRASGDGLENSYRILEQALSLFEDLEVEHDGSQ
ncbi:inositol monophosphatase [Basidiobolus meristosporus CBS 931.73]|uniref:Inositol-1-monophosphatase n=1 Tax=Basidiobolus meristosporus CBS 931.73 TaxID=1314790 RepID=A0A1Y1YPW4_9FUNG|nr:inositol monophosphatase [Basidiobolus meristosporus CBS 931.73]|eukprot:ORY00081.1 inositol monophosphatase [Basidiobolus meristosporus CBS 931.73]